MFLFIIVFDRVFGDSIERSIQSSEYTFEESLKSHLEAKLGGNNQVYIVSSGSSTEDMKSGICTLLSL